jgi:hypothetical protein
MCTIKLPISIIKQIDKYKRHCLWRGGDLNAKKPPLVAWKLVTRPKKKGGLGVLKLRVQNDALLMKNLHKFFSKANLLWVKLIWNKYYGNGSLPGQRKKGSFWWRSVLRLLNTFKGIIQAHLGSGDTILFWDDLWNGQILKFLYPQLHSFAINGSIIVKEALNLGFLQDLFHLLLSQEAYEQLCELDIAIQSLQQNEEQDYWSYIWGNGTFSSTKAYTHMMRTEGGHLTFTWLWHSICQ